MKLGEEIVQVLREQPDQNGLGPVETSKAGFRRIQSLDVVRGLIMIVMALDHVRDYFHADAFVYDPGNLGKTSVLLFITRWITHLCAPLFVLLSGTSAFLAGRSMSKAELSQFLLKRGLLLVLIEILIINFAWSFNIHLPRITLGVLWAIGMSMIFLAGIIYMPRKIIFLVGIVMIAAHNLLDTVHVAGDGPLAFLWGVLHERKVFTFGGTIVRSSYPLIPWIGVMAIGYALGSLYDVKFDDARRKQLLIYLGSACVFLFILIRAINLYGDPSPWSMQATSTFTVLSFLNTTKYPPSLDFLLMTIGPGLIFLALTEKWSSPFAMVAATYGKVPLFYYIVHLYAIHFLAMIAAVLSGYAWSNMILSSSIHDAPGLEGYGFSLSGVYIIWIALVAALYSLCRLYTNYKKSHKEKWWLQYL